LFLDSDVSLAVTIRTMTDDKNKKRRPDAADINALEADVAFFDARISLAGDYQDTVYQKAQKKIYETLGEVVSSDLEKLRNRSKGR